MAQPPKDVSGKASFIHPSQNRGGQTSASGLMGSPNCPKVSESEAEAAVWHPEIIKRLNENQDILNCLLPVHAGPKRCWVSGGTRPRKGFEKHA